MLTFGVIDDGVGIFPTYYKLRQVVCGNFVCMLLDDCFPLNKLCSQQLYNVGKQAVNTMTGTNCDVIVLSSACLSSIGKRLASACNVPLYGLEAPVLHASTYTASNVLVCFDSDVSLRTRLPNAIYIALNEFPLLAEQCRERQIVEYLEQRLQPYFGRFDCIALASSSMNLYKHCFSRVCPNARVFDSLDGVARKIRKKYSKLAKDEGVTRIINHQGEDITEKYAFFLE